MRSLIEPPGLRNSHFPKRLQTKSSLTRFKGTSGVLPIASRIELRSIVSPSVYNRLDITPGMKLERYNTHDIEIVIDRMLVEDTPENEKRLAQSIQTAMYHGENILMILEHDKNEIRFFSRNLMCPTTGISYQNPEPNLFSFNSPKGACDHCNGLGTVHEINIKKIIPNPKISIKHGGFLPLGEYKNTWIFY
jgi:excinuclease ABC subunit A